MSFRRHLALDNVYPALDDFILEISKKKSIWIAHFHEVDMNLKFEGDDAYLPERCKLNNIKTKNKTNTGENSIDAFPRPAATKVEIERSLFFTKNNVKKRRLSSPSFISSEPIKERIPKPKSNLNLKLIHLKNDGNKLKLSVKHSIVSADKILTAVHMGAHHSKQCGGNIHSRADNVVHRGLALTIKFTCSLGNKCRCWKNGIWKWVTLILIQKKPGLIIIAMSIKVHSLLIACQHLEQ